jgi:hypothetical protein
MCYSLWYNAPTMLPAVGRQVKISIWNTETRTFGYFTMLRHILWFFGNKSDEVWSV